MNMETGQVVNLSDIKAELSDPKDLKELQAALDNKYLGIGEIIDIRGYKFRVYGMRNNGRVFLKLQKDTKRTYVKETK